MTVCVCACVCVCVCVCVFIYICLCVWTKIYSKLSEEFYGHVMDIGLVYGIPTLDGLFYTEVNLTFIVFSYVLYDHFK